MDPFIKDLIQVVTWLVAAIGGVIAAFKAVSELHRSNEERAEAIRERQVQFRWRQAEMARTILDQTWSNNFARSALKMLDWSGLKYERAGATTEPITHENVYHALRTTNLRFTDDEQYVRDCFDQLFDDFERMEHYLNIGLVNWDDIQGRLDYHVNLLARQRKIHEQFLRAYQFKLALLFLERFPQWSAA
jgi:hypothetical protein